MMTPREPFKFLDAYTKEDKDIFFGRDAEIEELYARVFQSQLLLVYGPSGTGKTSLIQCGLANKFEDPDWLRLRQASPEEREVSETRAFASANWLPLFIRYDEDIFASIDREISKCARTEMESGTPLRERLLSLYLDHFKPLYLIFDQFEDLFIFGTADERERLAEEIAVLLDVSFEIHVLFVIREEYLAELSALDPHLPDLFDNRLRVERMGRAGALSAIKEPCKVCGIDIEEGLAERILKWFGAGPVELPDLQILLDKLYAKARKANPDSPRLTGTALEAFGTLGDILATFLEEQLAAMDAEEASLGEAALKTLITPEATKKKMGVNEIVSALPVDHKATPKQVAAILNCFVAVRVLREKDEAGRYELRHDSLARKIFERLSALEKDLLEVLQMVENRYKEYQIRGTLLDEAALEYVTPYESRLRFKPQIAKFINASRREITRVKRRRNLILGGVLLVVFLLVSGLGFYSYLQYRKAEDQRQKADQEKDNALRTQSLFLANLARQENEEDNYGNAILLSLEALPEDMNAPDRPYVPEAEVQLYRGVVHLLEQKLSFGHTDAVYSAAYSPDGSRIVSTSADGTVWVWDAVTGQELQQLIGHKVGVPRVTYSHDGSRIISASWDRTARVWDAATGQELLRLIGHEGDVYHAAYSPDDRHIVSASADRTARVWDAATGQELLRLIGHEGGVYHAEYSPDSRYIVSASADGTVRVWDATSGQELLRLEEHEEDVTHAAYSPDGSRIVSASADKTVRVWDVSTALNTGSASGQNLLRLEGHTDAVYFAVYSPDGSRIVSASEDKTVRVWDATSGQEVLKLEGHTDAVNSATYSPDSRCIVTASTDETVRVWDAASGQELRRLEWPAREVTYESPRSDGTYIVSHTLDSLARVWDSGNSQKLMVLVAGVVDFAAYNPDGRRIVSASADGTVRVWDVVTGQELLRLIGHEGDVYHAEYSPDSRHIVSASADGTGRVWDATSGQELLRLEGHEEGVTHAAYSPDGRRIVSASWDDTVRVWDATSGQELLKLEGHTDTVCFAAYSPDGRRIVSASDDDTVRVWDAVSGQELLQLAGHNYVISSGVYSPDGRRIVSASDDDTAAYSPDGSRIVSASNDDTVRVWDAVSGQELLKLEGHTGAVNSAGYSPDGSRIVSASWDNTVRVWGATSGQELWRLEGFTSSVTHAAYSPDGANIIIVFTDGTVRVWPLFFTQELIDTARKIVPYRLTPAQRKQFFLE